MILARHSVDSSAAPQALWQRWAEVRTWPDWDPSLASASLEGAFEAGARLRLVPKGGQPREFRIKELDAGGRFTLEARLLGATLCQVHRVEASSLGSRATVQIEIHGWLGWLHGWFLKGLLRAALPLALRGVARAASTPPQ